MRLAIKAADMNLSSTRIAPVDFDERPITSDVPGTSLILGYSCRFPHNL